MFSLLLVIYSMTTTAMKIYVLPEGTVTTVREDALAYDRA
jgi:hypothetical protein